MKKSTLLAVMLALLSVATVSAVAQELPEEQTGGGTYGAVPTAVQETPSDAATGLAVQPRDLIVEQILSGDLDRSLDSPRVLLAPSATALSSAIGIEVRDSGEGTYLAAFWGYKPTPGYPIAVESARLEDDRVTVGLNLQDMGSNLQAVSYPYAVAVLREPDLLGKGFSFVDQYGQELGWPIYRVSG